MPYLYIDDGGPAADEYANNFFQFDCRDDKKLFRIQEFLREKDTRDPKIRQEIMSFFRNSL